jgi:hypothetical protein
LGGVVPRNFNRHFEINRLTANREGKVLRRCPNHRSPGNRLHRRDRRTQTRPTLQRGRRSQQHWRRSPAEAIRIIEALQLKQIVEHELPNFFVRNQNFITTDQSRSL